MDCLQCDVLMIGSGAGGLSAAVTARHHGLEVVVAEKEALWQQAKDDDEVTG